MWSIRENTEMTQAVLLRHGESVSNSHPDLIALPDDVGDRLTDRGRDQARIAAEGLIGFGLTRVWTSPMRRARETAEVVGDRLGLPVSTISYVHELTEEEGYTRLSAESQRLQRSVNRMGSHPDDPDFTLNGSESLRQVISRVRRLKHELESQPEAELPLIITHGIFSRFFFFDSLLGDSFNPRTTSQLWNLGSRNCGLSIFKREVHWQPDQAGTPSWTCVTWMSVLQQGQ
jgi:uncharacterized phosphatase